MAHRIKQEDTGDANGRGGNNSHRIKKEDTGNSHRIKKEETGGDGRGGNNSHRIKKEDTGGDANGLGGNNSVHRVKTEEGTAPAFKRTRSDAGFGDNGPASKVQRQESVSSTGSGTRVHTGSRAPRRAWGFVMTIDKLEEAAKQTAPLAFTGKGHRLGDSAESSEVVQGEEQAPAPAASAATPPAGRSEENVYQLVVCEHKEMEDLLRAHPRANHGSMPTMINSLKGFLPMETLENIRKISNVRNNLVHNSIVDCIPDVTEFKAQMEQAKAAIRASAEQVNQGHIRVQPRTHPLPLGSKVVNQAPLPVPVSIVRPTLRRVQPGLPVPSLATKPALQQQQQSDKSKAKIAKQRASIRAQQKRKVT